MLQVVATIAVRSESGGWVRLVPQALALRIDDAISAYPLPPLLRLVLARDALARGDLARAERDANALAPSADRSALVAGIARARGDLASAARADLAADDLQGVAADVAALVARGRIPEAVALERALVARLEGERTQADVLARASFSLGDLEETQAYQFAVGSAVRADHERLSLVAYERAANLAPLDLRYLIATGNQALNVGDFETATALFTRAERIDPRSPDPVAGLGDLAFRRGDLERARGELARAEALDARDPAVVRLALKLAQ